MNASSKNRSFNQTIPFLMLVLFLCQVISNIRTIYSITGETKAISDYSNSLAEGLKIEKKRGVAKGIGIGFFYSLLFFAWALLLWYSSVLVRHGNAGGANAFATIIIVIFSYL